MLIDRAPPPTYTETQLVGVIGISLEDPVDSGNPCTHWTAKEVALEASDRKVAEGISVRTVQRLFAEADFKPQQMKYYTGRVSRDDPAFAAATQEISATYKAAPDLYEEGTNVACIDEKTGIQAIEPIQITLPPMPGSVERRGHDYHRHGTLDLFISFLVPTGTIALANVTPTRTEVDLVAHVSQTIATGPDKAWVFVMDNLNTHVYEGLVNLVAELCGIEADLGKKGSSGILKNMKTRRAFLEDESHWVRFAYTPNHASWLNQAEIWFSILVRKLLKRGLFSSLDDLKAKIEAFVAYFNAVLAKPFKWTYAGRPLVAGLGCASS